ncbi:hypothetical protein BUALT_Bualt10G0016300 [Buddleja alternifolia]|uniref:Man1/Src1-like C-terminal domain-containing protein n=1 Tax=Buddleja alternifolia TaxID=168488 RepID=A0AAV6X654_9LAMI|nr:hypothetical protein BUALT_Bualt10G0016300 [Buddleja alternifolia]
MASDTRKKKKKPKPSSPTLFPVEPSSNSLPSSKADLSRLIAVVSIAAAVAVACNLIANSLNQPPKPFCDTVTDDFLSVSESILVAYFIDYCEPCPANGVCYDGKFECGEGYKKHGNLCIEDGDINEAAKKLSKWVEAHVCEAYAQLLCSGTGKNWVSENELWSNLRAQYGQDENLTSSAFCTYMFKLVDHIESLTSKCFHYNLSDSQLAQFLHSNAASWVQLNFYVALPHGLTSHALWITPIMNIKFILQVEFSEMAIEVCDILEEKPLTSRSKSGDGEPWVVASWLRDHILSPKERRDPKLWRKVEELVQEDSRVDQYPKLVKGESKVVWEWQVEGPLSSSGKRKKSDGKAPKLKEAMNTSSNVQSWMHAGEP